MKLISTYRLLLAVTLTLFVGAVGCAHAQSYPSRPITIVVPYPAGGVTDNLVRLLAERMKNSLGQSIVIENIGGGGGTIGVDRVSRAAPDGYTLVLGNSESMVFAPVTMAISYNALTDFEPVALLPSYPFLLVTTNDVPAKNLEELDRVVQGKPGQGAARHRRRRNHAAPLRPAAAKDHRREMAAGALSRRPAGDAGPARRADQLHVHHHRRLPASGA